MTVADLVRAEQLSASSIYSLAMASQPGWLGPWRNCLFGVRDAWIPGAKESSHWLTHIDGSLYRGRLHRGQR